MFVAQKLDQLKFVQPRQDLVYFRFSVHFHDSMTNSKEKLLVAVK